MEKPAPRKIILDTDTGADDTLGIVLALLSPELKVEAITTVSGNVHVDLCTRNARLVVEQLGLASSPPICRGAAKPLVKQLFTAPEVHGYDGLGQITHIVLPDGSPKYPEPSLPESTVPAVEMIVDLVKKLGPELTLVTVGPLTNIALAIRKDRVAMSRVGEIIIMGGAYRQLGNTTTAAEFNVFVDPHAVQEVLELGAPVTIVPLDVTERTILGRDELDRSLREHPTKALDLVKDVSHFYMNYHVDFDGVDGCFMHDPLAVGVAINPGFVRTIDAFVRVERTGEWTEGMMVVEPRVDRYNLTANTRGCL